MLTEDHDYDAIHLENTNMSNQKSDAADTLLFSKGGRKRLRKRTHAKTKRPSPQHYFFRDRQW